MAAIVCPTCGKVPPAGLIVCPNDGTALPTKGPTRSAYTNSAKISAAKPKPNISTGPNLHDDLNPLHTEKLSVHHLPEPMFTEKMSKLEAKLSFELHPGITIGEYIIEEKLGEGGMGEVWRARQPMIDKQVALKVLGQDIIANKSSLSRFLQEARAVNQIKHRNLVDIFSFGELPDGRPYMVMEYLDGKNLGAYLEQHGVLPFSEILQIFEQVCRALQAAHDRNIVHRDLKPDNIFLILDPNQPPFVKLLDFGIAKLSGDSEGKRLTHTNAVFGTPGYMAPEQYEGAKKVDHRADIYALAVILFEMLTGQSPFALPGESTFAVVARQMTSEPPKPSEKVSNRHIPAEVDAFILKALSKNPDERPQSCNELYQKLVQAVGKKASETREVLQAMAISAESTAVDISINPIDLAPKRQAPKSQLEGLVGEVVAGTQPNPTQPQEPKQKRKKVGVFLAIGGALSVGLILLFSFSQASPAQPVKPAPVSAPVSQPAPVVSLPTHPAKIKLTISSKPSGASVSLAGKDLGKTPIDLEIDYSEENAELKLKLPGYKELTKEISLQGDFTEAISLTPKSGKAKPEDGNKPEEKSNKQPENKNKPLDRDGVVPVQF